MFPLDISYLRPNLGDDNRLYFRYGNNYVDKVLGYSPIAYWPLDEASGTVAADVSGNDFHGEYTGVTLGQEGIGDGKTCPLFDGANDYVDLYSTGFRDAFDGDEGTISIWAKMYAAGTWADGKTHYLIRIEADASNKIIIRAPGAAGQIDWQYYSGSGNEIRSVSGLSHVDFMHIAWTWSDTDDEVKAYLNGAQQGATLTGVDDWVGLPISTGTLIGGKNTDPDDPWYGYAAHCAIFDSALLGTEIADIYEV